MVNCFFFSLNIIDIEVKLHAIHFMKCGDNKQYLNSNQNIQKRKTSWLRQNTKQKGKGKIKLQY